MFPHNLLRKKKLSLRITKAEIFYELKYKVNISTAVVAVL
jgi:hypothetical protein